ncbi:MAG: large conductance mechanosensitive channel protein MscL [Robiginitomaculum sp.]|nr:MAG: large conductance mechanosensitive channel protein MscL [Robiginitomaculum sp.]
MGMISEFKEFAVKGNMLDMAVGIIMGGAFGTIIKSLVSDVLMPPIGLLMGGVDFSALKIVLQAAEGDTAEVAINYGNFINALIAFLIVAFVLFQIIKNMNKFKKKEEAAPSAPPAQEVLLAEIRDLLKK